MGRRGKITEAIDKLAEHVEDGHLLSQTDPAEFLDTVREGLAEREELKLTVDELKQRLTVKDHVIASLHKEAVDRFNNMEEYAQTAARDELFYLTEILQQRFSHDFQRNTDNIYALIKELLVELHQRREGEFKPRHDDFLRAVRASAEDNYRLTDELPKWTDVEEAVHNKLGIAYLKQCFIDWMVGTAAVAGVDMIKVDK